MKVIFLRDVRVVSRLVVEVVVVPQILVDLFPPGDCLPLSCSIDESIMILVVTAFVFVISFGIT
jgi:hypothetical protein